MLRKYPGGGSMLVPQHYVLVYFFLFLFLLPIIGATDDRPRSGHAAAMDRRTAEQGMRSLNNSHRLLIFGYDHYGDCGRSMTTSCMLFSYSTDEDFCEVLLSLTSKRQATDTERAKFAKLAEEIQMNTSAWRRKDCVLDIFVEIGDNTWKQQLGSNSFVFQVPARSFGGMIGMVSIHERGGKWQRLWNHFFIVQDIGVQRLNATLSRDCSRIKIPGSALIPWIPAMCHSLSMMEKTNNLLQTTRLSTDVLLMCPISFRRYVENVCIISGALEIYPTTTYERKAYFGMAYLKTLMIFIDDQLRNSGESSYWHRVFGVYFLRTWHFLCLGIVFLFFHTVNWFLRILESLSAIALSNLDPPVTVDECPHTLLDWEPQQTSYPSSDTSFSGLSTQANIQSRHGSLTSSGDILYQDSWGDAHQYLRKLMDFPVDGSGYYYNCTVKRRSFSDLLHSGRWSRDSNGRLIRDRA